MVFAPAMFCTVTSTSIAVPNHVEDQAVLDLELLRRLRRQPDLDRVVTLVDAVDDATQRLRRRLARDGRSLGDCDDRFLVRGPPRQ